MSTPSLVFKVHTKIYRLPQAYISIFQQFQYSDIILHNIHAESLTVSHMPYGMKNSPATFQRLINIIITGLDNCKAYIDDAIIYSEGLDKQIKIIREFFERLTKAKLTIN